MKMIKKLAVLLLSVCLIVPCFSMLTYAADGKIQFEDPQAKTGETLELLGVVKKSSGTMGQIEIRMTYDTAMLKFKGGEGITESESGNLTYTGDATNETGIRKEFKIEFDVLKAGTTKVEIASATVKDVSGNVRDYTKGSSTITIAQGETPVVTEPDTTEPATPGATVEVNGASYVISNEIPENEIPDGYVSSTLEYDLVTYNVVQSGTSGISLAYLIGEDKVGDFFMYVEEDATFAPYEEIVISDSVTIALLSDVSEVVLPEEYMATSVQLNGQEFPAWQNAENPDYVILYAINSNGETSLYQLDNEEGTYQRFIAPEVVIEEEDHSFIGKLSDLLQNHMDSVILVTGLGFLLFVLIIVILSVKLYNRNAELDEIYDEYGIDAEEENADTEEDVVLDLEDEDEDYDNHIEDESDVEMEFFVQEGVKEVFPAEEISLEEESLDIFVQEKAVEESEPEMPDELSIDQVLARSLAEEKEEFYDDDDELLDDFSVDFIDLDD